MTDRIGQRLGNYRLLRLIGKGGFAEVYLGEHQGPAYAPGERRGD